MVLWCLRSFALIGWFIHPIFSWVGSIFGAISDGISKIPEEILQIALSIAAIAIAGRWIQTFSSREGHLEGRLD